LPTFVVIGAQKCGTTSLWRYLCLHPDVAMCSVKEPNFFLGGAEWAQGVAWYRQLFAGTEAATAVGEASTMYAMFPHAPGVPERIQRVLPEARLVYLVRHPIDRMVSLYGHHLAAGWEHRPIAQALLQDARYTDSSRYALQLEQYRRWVDPERILVVRTEDLAADPDAVVRRVWAFLGVDPTVAVPASAWELRANTRDDQRVPARWWWALGEALLRLHAGWLVPDVVVRHNRSRLCTRPVRPDERAVDDEVRRRLAEVLRPDLERLAWWMGADYDGWGLLG